MSGSSIPERRSGFRGNSTGCKLCNTLARTAKAETGTLGSVFRQGRCADVSGRSVRVIQLAMLCVRSLRRIRVWARDPGKAAIFAAREGARHGATIEVAGSPMAAVTGAGLICTVTKAREPILEGAWVAAGAHLNVVGSSIAKTAEVDTAAVVRSRFFVDRRESTYNEGGEYRRALAAGAITPDHIVAEIGEVANGSKPGRLSPRDVTMYKSLGIAPQDLASAYHVLQKARAAGIGQVVEL
jgi:ornithine cyclodeaminase/alanine dehydrogenase-like protein (mu-crystallin family)